MGDFPFNTDVAHVKAGIKNIGYGLLDVSHGVSDCQLQALADILAQLAVKLGVAPEVQWVEEVLHILIKGVEIEQASDVTHATVTTVTTVTTVSRQAMSRAQRV